MAELVRRYSVGGARWALGFTLLLLLVCLAALQAAFAQAPQERRIALLIGNAAYAEAVGPLKNPLNDIAELKRSLLATGFRESDIRVVANARLVDLRREMDAFAGRAAALRPDDIAFFYYSGHGAARAATGANYLIPVDAPRADTEDLWFASLPLEEAIATLKRGTRAATFVVIDACRNELKLARNGKDVSGSAGKAFAAVPTESGMLIAFAADQGQVAREGASRVAGGRLSPYAAALAQSLTTPNLPATAAFQAVRPQVVEWTGGAQEPVYTSKLNRDPVFVRARVAVAGPDPGVTAELERLRRENEELRRPTEAGSLVILFSTLPGEIAKADSYFADAFSTFLKQTGELESALPALSSYVQAKVGQQTPVFSTTGPPLCLHSCPNANNSKTSLELALVVGVSEYGSQLGNLEAPVSEARKIGEFFGNLGYKTEILENPDQQALSSQLQLLARKAGNDTTFVIYFSGLGYRTDSVDYVVASDGASISVPNLIAQIPEEANRFVVIDTARTVVPLGFVATKR